MTPLLLPGLPTLALGLYPWWTCASAILPIMPQPIPYPSLLAFFPALGHQGILSLSFSDRGDLGRQLGQTWQSWKWKEDRKHLNCWGLGCSGQLFQALRPESCMVLETSLVCLSADPPLPFFIYSFLGVSIPKIPCKATAALTLSLGYLKPYCQRLLLLIKPCSFKGMERLC